MKKFIFLSLIILFSLKTQNIFAYTEVFTVDNIEVEGKLKENNNREKYLQVAFRRGFQKLVTNIIQKDNQKELLSTDTKTINSLVSSYRILEEKTLNNTYNINVSLKFDRKLVEKFLFNKNISYSNTKELDIILYPILVENNELQVFSKNKFFEEWNKEKDLDNINFILPLENLDDIDFIKKNLESLEETDLLQLVSNYEIKNRAILVLRHNKKKLIVFLITDFSGAKKIKKIDFTLEDKNNLQKRRNIILILKNYINELWKEENLIDISVPSYLTLNTKIDDKFSLNKIIEGLENISLIDSYEVEKLDFKSAKIKIKFFGKIKNLQNRFNESGFRFEILHDEWNLYLNT